jgi:hypothetical protein
MRRSPWYSRLRALMTTDHSLHCVRLTSLVWG